METSEIKEIVINSLVSSDNKKAKNFQHPKYKNENKKKFELIEEKYIYRPFNKDNLCDELVKYKDKDMLDYLLKLINDISSPDQYLNETFLKDISDYRKSDLLIEAYKNSFFQVIDIIDMFFDNLLNNIDLCPYSIKCFCKIISILIKKKFPESIKVDQNKFLVIFFFKKIILKIIEQFENNYSSEDIALETSEIKEINQLKKK